MLESLIRQPHHSGCLLKRNVGITAAEHDAIANSGMGTGHHQPHQVAEGAAAGENTAALLRQSQSLTEPTAELLFEVGEPWGQFLRQQVVVQPGTDQVGGDRCRERRWIEMGQSSGMGRLIGTLHHQLQILEQPVHAEACRGGGDGRLRAHGRQGHPFGRRTDPVAEQITGPMEEVP